MKLALFDLDHTLIPFDSGMAWTRFLVARGVLPAQLQLPQVPPRLRPPSPPKVHAASVA